MKSNIIVSSKIYETYKDEILVMNARLFIEPYFYNLKDYKDPFDLTGIKEYLSFIDEVIIHSLTSFIDFINVLLILRFLKSNDYKGIVSIRYYNTLEKDYKKAVILNKELKKDEYKDVDRLIDDIASNKKVDTNAIKLPGTMTYLSFFNQLIDPTLFKELISDVIEEYEEDIDDIALNLSDIYSNMGLNKKFYKEYLEKII